MILAPKYTLRHACGLVFRNVTKNEIKLKENANGNAICPQCGNPVKPSDIRNEAEGKVTWTLHPPHGMAFKNSLGSEVTITFDVGREQELFQALMVQLQNHMQPSVNARMGPRKLPGAGNIPRNNVTHAVPTVRIDEDGTLILESKDEVPPANGNPVTKEGNEHE